MVAGLNEEVNWTHLLWAPYQNTSYVPGIDITAAPTVGSPVQFWTHGDATNTLSLGATAGTTESWVPDGSIKIWLWAKATSTAEVRLTFGACSSGAFDADTRTASIAVTSSSWTLLYQELAVPGGIVVPTSESFCVSMRAFTASGTPTITVGASYPHFSRINAGYLPSLQQ